MNRRNVFIENTRVMADSGEITTPINVRDPITTISVDFRATNGATNNLDCVAADCLTSIDLLDGSEILWSLSGKQAAALSAYNLGHIPQSLISEIPGNDQSCFFFLQFGRWPGDTSYAFDPSKFNNPQIRLKWNLAAVNAVGATGFVSGTGRVSYVAEVMEGAQVPQAMLCAKQEYSFTTAASGDETIDLPIDRRIKRILLRSYEAGVGNLSGISNVKLSVDQDKFIPMDLSRAAISRMMFARNDRFSYTHCLMKKNADTFYSLLKYLETPSFFRDSGDTVINYNRTGIGEGAMAIYTAGVAAAAALTIYAEVAGLYPFSCVSLDMGEWDDPASWMETPLYKSLRMILTNSNAGAACSIVLETEKVY